MVDDESLTKDAVVAGSIKTAQTDVSIQQDVLYAFIRCIILVDSENRISCREI